MSNDQTKPIQDPSAHHTSSRVLIRRFLPYLAKYKGVLFFDLFCAALTKRPCFWICSVQH